MNFLRMSVKKLPRVRTIVEVVTQRETHSNLDPFQVEDATFPGYSTTEDPYCMHSEGFSTSTATAEFSGLTQESKSQIVEAYAYSSGLFSPRAMSADNAEGNHNSSEESNSSNTYSFSQFQYSENQDGVAGHSYTSELYSNKDADLLRNVEASGSTVLNDHCDYMSYVPGISDIMASSSSHHGYPPNDCWISSSGQYDFDQFSEYLQGESGSNMHPSSGVNDDPHSLMRAHHHHHHHSPHHYVSSPAHPAIHVNPAVIDGNYGMSDRVSPALINLAGLGPANPESGLSSADFRNDSSSVTIIKKTPRQAGIPTNIVPTAKMDRKTLKRLRNRVSASRCRNKKKGWIKDMETTALTLADDNRRLVCRLSQLEDAIAQCQRLLEYGNPSNLPSKSCLVLESAEKAFGEVSSAITGRALEQSIQLSSSTLIETADMDFELQIESASPLEQGSAKAVSVIKQKASTKSPRIKMEDPSDTHLPLKTREKRKQKA
jgi:hypothetical protein